MSNYICGITIGPIYETILKANSPLSLWYSSILFSKISLDIINSLQKKCAVNIVSPYYDDKDDLSDGVGKYPDRIVFTIYDVDSEKLKSCIKKVLEKEKESIAELIFADLKKVLKVKNVFDEKYLREYFANYLQFNYYFEEVKANEFGGQLLHIQKILDYLELSQTFNTKVDIEDNNGRRIKKDPLITLYSGMDKKENYYLKRSSLFTSYVKENVFDKDIKNLTKMEEFAKKANDKEESKIGKYIAIIKADGDNFGSYIKSIQDEETMSAFSESVYNFSNEAKKVIKKYGAAIYYMGGDDILMLAPLREEKDNEEDSQRLNIFGLCEQINAIFINNFETHNEKIRKQNEDAEDKINELSLSFGISIKYYKFPLYENLNIADDLLYRSKELFKNIVKNATTEEDLEEIKINEELFKNIVKNATTVNIIKNSSTAFTIAFKNDELCHISKLVYKAMEEKEDLVRAIIYKLADYSELFSELLKNERFIDDDNLGSKVNVLFDNIIDFYKAQSSSGYDKVIKDMYIRIVKVANHYRVKVDGDSYFFNTDYEIYDNLLKLITLLKIAKFYIEEGGY